MLDLGYYTNLSEWAQVYGKENIIIRTYEKSQLPHGIEYDFFVNILGIASDLLSGLDLFKEVNASIKKDIIEYKLSAEIFNLNQEILALNDLPALDYLSENNRKNILTAKQSQELLEYYKEDNEKIAREYLGREDGVLFHAQARDIKDDYPGLSLQAALDISRELVYEVRNNERVRLQGAQDDLTATKSELEAARADLDSERVRLQGAQNDLTATKSELEAARADLDNERVRLEKSQNSLQIAQVALENEKSRLEALYKSTSWRITKPLRAVKQFVCGK